MLIKSDFRLVLMHFNADTMVLENAFITGAMVHYFMDYLLRFLGFSSSFYDAFML